MNDDAKDIRLYLKGGMSAFHRLYTRYERPLFFYIRSMVRHEQTAEDLFQDVWVTAVKKLPSFTFKGEFRNWLYTIAHHKVIDHVRSAATRTACSLDENLGGEGEGERTLQDLVADPGPNVVKRLGDRELCDKVRAVAATLPEAQREVFLLRVDAELSFREIAEMTGAPLNTVLGRMHYAVQHLRKTLNQEMTS